MEKKTCPLHILHISVCQKNPTLILTNSQPSVRPYGGNKLWSAANQNNKLVSASELYSFLNWKRKLPCVCRPIRSCGSGERANRMLSWGTVKAAVLPPKGSKEQTSICTHMHNNFTHTVTCKSIHSPHIFSHLFFCQPYSSAYFVGFQVLYQHS